MTAHTPASAEPLHRRMPQMRRIDGTLYWVCAFSGLRWKVTPEELVSTDAETYWSAWINAYLKDLMS